MFRFRIRVFLVALMLTSCKACTEQHDPRPDWKIFEGEEKNANRKNPILDEKGNIPPVVVKSEEVAGNPIDKKYANFCGGCHGVEGGGDGPAGAALNPKPRNFQNWDYVNDIPTSWKGKSDEYIAKVIAEGGLAVGKSALMAPWGGVLSGESLTQMVEKVKSFKK